MGITPILAQFADVTSDPFLVRRITDPEFLVGVAIIVGIIMGGLIAITKLVTRHRERMAKIQMGIDPDAPPKTSDALQDNR